MFNCLIISLLTNLKRRETKGGGRIGAALGARLPASWQYFRAEGAFSHNLSPVTCLFGHHLTFRVLILSSLVLEWGLQESQMYLFPIMKFETFSKVQEVCLGVQPFSSLILFRTPPPPSKPCAVTLLYIDSLTEQERSCSHIHCLS